MTDEKERWFTLYLSHERYDEIVQEVTFMYEECGIHTYPIDPFEVARILNYHVVPYSEIRRQSEEEYQKAMLTSPDGFAELRTGSDGLHQDYIFYNDALRRTRIRWTIFHEIGHLYLGHLDELVDYAKAESEANFFAKHAIAPQPLIHRNKCADFTEVADLFDTSWEAGWNIFYSYKKWLYQGPDEFLPHELKILDMFPAA